MAAQRPSAFICGVVLPLSFSRSPARRHPPAATQLSGAPAADTIRGHPTPGNSRRTGTNCRASTPVADPGPRTATHATTTI